MTQYNFIYTNKKYKIMGRNKGFTVSEETRQKVSLANKGKKQSEEAKQKISLANKGNKHTDETKLKISLANKGRRRIINKKYIKRKLKYIPEFTERITKKGYVIICVNHKFVFKHRYIYEKVFGKIPEGKVIHHIDHNKLNNNIDNLVALTIGEHNSIHSKGKKQSHNIRSQKICQIDKKTLILVKVYDRLSDIEGYNLGCISNCCNLKRKSHNGFLWYFYNECIFK